MEILKVSSKSNPSKVAGAIANVFREHGSVEIHEPVGHAELAPRLRHPSRLQLPHIGLPQNPHQERHHHQRHQSAYFGGIEGHRIKNRTSAYIQTGKKAAHHQKPVHHQRTATGALRGVMVDEYADTQKDSKKIQQQCASFIHSYHLRATKHTLFHPPCTALIC